MSEFQPFKFNIGRYRCTVIHDGGHMGKASFVFANAPEGELNQTLQEYHLEPDKIPSSWNCLFIDTGDKKLLVDTGYGPRDGLPEGKLIETLREIGVHPSRISLWTRPQSDIGTKSIHPSQPPNLAGMRPIRRHP
jgi:hypothetical protein